MPYYQSIFSKKFPVKKFARIYLMFRSNIRVTYEMSWRNIIFSLIHYQDQDMPCICVFANLRLPEFIKFNSNWVLVESFYSIPGTFSCILSNVFICNHLQYFSVFLHYIMPTYLCCLICQPLKGSTKWHFCKINYI